jgi:hypothetical protein
MPTKGNLIDLAAFQKNDVETLVPAVDLHQADAKERAQREAVRSRKRRNKMAAFMGSSLATEGLVTSRPPKG